MGETITFKPPGASEITDVSIVSGELSDTTLVLTKGNSTIISIPLAALVSDKVTQADIDTAISLLVDSAPGVLNTLNELATALGNDANFATTVTTALAGKLAIAGHDANSVPVSISGTLADLDFPASSFLVRLASGNIKAGTITEVKELLALAESDITGLVADLALKAPLASPTFTGTPAAPTASLNTNTTQVATTAFVLAQIAALVASSPAALDTLNELAAALGNDANFATTVTNALALKAPIASPTFTGTPAAPTAAGGTNTTQVATTAYVQGEVSSKASVIENVNNHGDTGSAYTFPDVTSYTVHRVRLNAATVTFTMPTAGAGKSFTVKAKQDGTGGRLATFTGVIWPGGTAPTLTTTANHADTLVFYCIDGSVWEGALVAADYAS